MHFTRLPNALLDSEVLGAHEVLVALAMLRRGGEKGVVYATQKNVAQLARLSVRAVQRSLTKLKELGFFATAPKRSMDGPTTWVCRNWESLCEWAGKLEGSTPEAAPAKPVEPELQPAAPRQPVAAKAQEPTSRRAEKVDDMQAELDALTARLAQQAEARANAAPSLSGRLSRLAGRGRF